MGRVPGEIQEKVKILEKLNEVSFLYLIADILYFSRNHRHVRIVDGPGDGRRDIHSFLPNGEKCVTQCKYHKAVNTSVSSRETDELPIALTKFGVKDGIFATTGRISPQGKREYLDNFPGFNLDFLEGPDVVDLVLTNPILRAVWYDDASIQQVSIALGIPFIIRSAATDSVVSFPRDYSDKIDGLHAEIETVAAHSQQFHPYRPPTIPDRNEGGKWPIWCPQFRMEGDIRLSSIDKIQDSLITVLANLLKDECVIVRLGLPIILPHGQESDEAGVSINSGKPTSYVIDKGMIFPEKDWVVFSGTSEWQFPRNLSVEEAPWAGWVGLKDNCVVMEELAWTIFDGLNYVEEEMQRAKLDSISKSLFALGDARTADALISENDLMPNLRVNWGQSDILLVWLFPEMPTSLSKAKAFASSGQPSIAAFHHLTKTIRHLLVRYSMKEIGYEKAKHILAFEEIDLENAPSETGVSSPDLFHDYDDVPSPVDLTKRTIVFIWMWQVYGSLEKGREKINSNQSQIDGLFLDLRKGTKSGKPFLMSTIARQVPATMSTDEFMSEMASFRKVREIEIHKWIRGLWMKAKLATIDFWRDEVGFKIENDAVFGNPYVAFMKRDGTVDYRWISEGDTPDDIDWTPPSD